MALIEQPLPLRETHVLDANAEALGVPVRTLMDRAGQELARVVAARCPEGPVVLLCGPGNNGGDGLVAARYLAEERPVTVVMTRADPSSDLTRDAARALPPTVDRLVSPGLADEALADALGEARCLVDALLGAGATGAPRGEVARLLELASGVEAYRVSVDHPTGHGSEQAFRPDVVVAMQAPKRGLDPGLEQVVVDVGIPERAWTHTGPGEFRLYPPASPTQHKGQGGFVLVIGGGPYAGAPALSALAAMRTGADMSIVLTPEESWPAVASFSPNVVARRLEGRVLDLENPKNRVELNKWLGMVDAVLIGPGLGKMDPVHDSVPIALDRCHELGLPVVIDADALRVLADRELDLRGRGVVTPHASEFQSLTGKAVPEAGDVEGRLAIAREAAASINATVLLKGPVDVVTDGTLDKRNATGTPQMSHGGTGDVLAGITTGLLAKGMGAFDAARLGAYLAGKAGEHATREKSYGMLATDLVESIPAVLRAHLDP